MNEKTNNTASLIEKALEPTTQHFFGPSVLKETKLVDMRMSAIQNRLIDGRYPREV